MGTPVSQLRLRFPKWVIVLLLVAFCTSLGWAQGEPLVIVQNGKYGYIDHTGKIIIQPSYIWAEGFSQGLGTTHQLRVGIAYPDCEPRDMLERPGRSQPSHAELWSPRAPRREWDRV